MSPQSADATALASLKAAHEHCRKITRKDSLKVLHCVPMDHASVEESARFRSMRQLDSNKIARTDWEMALRPNLEMAEEHEESGGQKNDMDLA